MSEFTHLRTAKLSVVTDRHLLDLKLRNFSPRTIDSYTGTFKDFNHWCSQRGVTIAGELTEEVISGYRRYLYHRISEATRKPLSFNTQSHKLHTVRCFCRWAFQNEIVDADPSTKLIIPNAKNRQLANVLTGEEMAALLNAPDLTTPLGLRNRAIIETFYSTAIRATELRNLSLSDVDAARTLVHVRHGKGGKDRLVPIGTNSLEWIEKYRIDVRPSLACPASDNKLFLGLRGRPLSREALAAIVKGSMRKAGIEKSGACHILRHTAATLMMENGADLRALQVYLGHSKLDTTQIYTHMSLGRLKEVHQKTHPTGDERIKRQPDDRPNDDDQPHS